MKNKLRILAASLMLITLFGATLGCSKKDTNQKVSDKTLAERLMEEAQLVTDFIRDEGFIYGDAKINPGFNWEFLDSSKAINPGEKIVSCDRLVDWILFRVGFIDQVYTQGMTVWTLGPWCEEHNFEKIEDMQLLQAGDIVFVNPDNKYRPAHVFMCASSVDENGMYLRYDAGSDARLQCKKGTEAVAGQQPFLEPIHQFMYAYRPNDSMLEEKYKEGPGSISKPNIDISIEISKGTPTIDGKIDTNEYKSKYTMDKTNCNPWQGIIGDSKADVYFAWDEEALYYAAEVTDNSPAYESDDKSWFSVDCVQLAVNPGNLIKKTDGIFFSFGAKKDNTVVTFRHNYDEKIISDSISAASSGHVSGSNSYIIEAKIPWDMIAFKTTTGNTIDTSSFVAKSGAEINLLPCIIDCKEGSTTLNCAYKFKGSNFNVSSFVPGKLVD